MRIGAKAPEHLLASQSLPACGGISLSGVRVNISACVLLCTGGRGRNGGGVVRCLSQTQRHCCSAGNVWKWIHAHTMSEHSHCIWKKASVLCGPQSPWRWQRWSRHRTLQGPPLLFSPRAVLFLPLFFVLIPRNDPNGFAWSLESLRAFLSHLRAANIGQNGPYHLYEIYRRIPAIRRAWKVSLLSIYLEWQQMCDYVICQPCLEMRRLLPTAVRKA